MNQCAIDAKRPGTIMPEDYWRARRIRGERAAAAATPAAAADPAAATAPALAEEEEQVDEAIDPLVQRP